MTDGSRQASPDTNLGRLLYSYYGTYSYEEAIQHEDDDPDWNPATRDPFIIRPLVQPPCLATITPDALEPITKRRTRTPQAVYSPLWQRIIASVKDTDSLTLELSHSDYSALPGEEQKAGDRWMSALAWQLSYAAGLSSILLNCLGNRESSDGAKTNVTGPLSGGSTTNARLAQQVTASFHSVYLNLQILEADLCTLTSSSHASCLHLQGIQEATLYLPESMIRRTNEQVARVCKDPEMARSLCSPLFGSPQILSFALQDRSPLGPPAGTMYPGEVSLCSTALDSGLPPEKILLRDAALISLIVKRCRRTPRN